MRYEFYCEQCDKTTVVHSTLAEYKIEDCSLCHQPMKRVYSKPLINPGALDANNVYKG
jgi:predicted nucleic acid-binding Zn ribbon protein